jgi:hypothetical protein
MTNSDNYARLKRAGVELLGVDFNRVVGAVDFSQNRMMR